MSKRSALVLAVAVGFSLWGCSDEKAGPGVGPETSWRVRCSENDPGMVCGTAQDPHGPLDGSDEESGSDDFKLSAKCSKEGSGLAITITDPGRDANLEKGIRKRARSILSITRANADDNECVVSVTEYPNSGSPKELKVQENCAGNSAAAGTCVFEGEENSNGYAFEGSVRCDGMKSRNVGDPAFILTGVGSADDPVVLQISSCD